MCSMNDNLGNNVLIISKEEWNLEEKEFNYRNNVHNSNIICKMFFDGTSSKEVHRVGGVFISPRKENYNNPKLKYTKINTLAMQSTQIFN